MNKKLFARISFAEKWELHKKMAKKLAESRRERREDLNNHFLQISERLRSKETDVRLQSAEIGRLKDENALLRGRLGELPELEQALFNMVEKEAKLLQH